MKKALLLLALGSATHLSANYYQQGQPYYQGQSYNYPGQPYYQGQSYYYQGQPYYQGQYYQDQGQPYYQGQYYDQGQYYQGQGNQWQNGQPYYNQGQNYNQGQQYNQGQANFQNPQNPNERVNVQWSEESSKQDMNNNRQGNGNSQDREIEKKISETVTGGWFSKGYNTISYQVDNGRVTLMGTVDTEEDKRQVENSVSKVPGVTGVDNQIKVTGKLSSYNNNTGYNSNTGTTTRQSTQSGDYDSKALSESERKYPNDSAATESDRQINAKVRKKLSGWVSNGYNDTIILKTTNGVVILTGTVKSQDDIQKVMDQVKKVDGVRNVNTQLSVKK